MRVGLIDAGQVAASPFPVPCRWTIIVVEEAKLLRRVLVIRMGFVVKRGLIRAQHVPLEEEDAWTTDRETCPSECRIHNPLSTILVGIPALEAVICCDIGHTIDDVTPKRL